MFTSKQSQALIRHIETLDTPEQVATFTAFVFELPLDAQSLLSPALTRKISGDSIDEKPKRIGDLLGEDT